ncbi:MAG: hypothetical protein K6E40_16340, partial [Desulfovibrio sp.]|nr:hypothetical protein [Desulfovibrio sp.]
ESSASYKRKARQGAVRFLDPTASLAMSLCLHVAESKGGSGFLAWLDLADKVARLLGHAGFHEIATGGKGWQARKVAHLLSERGLSLEDVLAGRFASGQKGALPVPVEAVPLDELRPLIDKVRAMQTAFKAGVAMSASACAGHPCSSRQKGTCAMGEEALAGTAEQGTATGYEGRGAQEATVNCADLGALWRQALAIAKRKAVDAAGCLAGLAGRARDIALRKAHALWRRAGEQAPRLTRVLEQGAEGIASACTALAPRARTTAQAATELARAAGDLCWFVLRASASACIASLLRQARRGPSPATAGGTGQQEATSPAPSADRSEAGVPATGSAKDEAFAGTPQELPQDAPLDASPEALCDVPLAFPLTPPKLASQAISLITPKATQQATKLCALPALPAAGPEANAEAGPATGPCDCPAPAMLPAGAGHADHSAQAAYAGTACQKHAQGPASAALAPLQALLSPKTRSTSQTGPSPQTGSVPAPASPSPATLAKLTKAKPAFRPPAQTTPPERGEYAMTFHFWQG